MCRRLVSFLLAIFMVAAMMPAALADEVVELEELNPDMGTAAVIEDTSVVGEVAAYVESTIAEDAAPAAIEEIVPAEDAALEVIGDVIPEPVADVVADVAPIFVGGYVQVHAGAAVYDAAKANVLGTIANDEIVLGFADANPDWLVVTFDVDGQAIEGCVLAAAATPLSLAETQDYAAKLAQYSALRVCKGYAVPVASNYVSAVVAVEPVVDVVAAPVIANDQASAVVAPVEPVVDYLPDADDIEILALTVAINTEDAATQAVVEEIEEIDAAPVEAVTEVIAADVEPIDDTEITVDVALAGEDEGLRGLVSRCYSLILQRTPDEAGLQWHVDTIKSGTLSVVADVWTFVDSPEMQARNLSDQKTLELLYETMMGRKADKGGLEYWMKRLKVGVSMRYIIAQFGWSKEFDEICESFGVANPGAETLPLNERDKNIGNTAFAYRIYVEVLERTPETDGIEYWAGILNNGTMTINDIANFFFFSAEEVVKKNWNDSQFLERAYHLFFDRASDEGGRNYWLGQLAGGMTRQAVVAAMCGVEEFQYIIAHPMEIVDKQVVELEDDYKDFEFEMDETLGGAVVKKYIGDASVVVVPDDYNGTPIVKIGDSAFEGNTKITKVSLPDTIQIIGKRAFAGCTSLAEMD